jgi:hypothetical protein
LTLYRVSGPSAYLGHKPGDTFIGELEPEVEARAVRRGSITVENRQPVGLDATRATLPRGWISQEPLSDRQPARR